MVNFHSFVSRRGTALAVGCVALATGGIVLLRAPERGHAESAPPAAAAARAVPGSPHRVAPPTGLPALPAGPTLVQFSGPGTHGRLALSQSGVLADGTREIYAEVRVSADAVAAREQAAAHNRPVALAIALDVSGSMAGDKIAQARAAVAELVDRMRDFDQIALVTYSDAAHVIQPLARVGDVRAVLRRVIPTITEGGGTMIPLGLGAATDALASAAPGVVRRVVLVSDGQDTSGTPLPLVGEQVRRRATDGITLSSLGIGVDFDERFMTTVADAGRGNYEFLRDGSQLRAFLAREMQQTTATTVEGLTVAVTLPAGWRLARAYGVEAAGSTGTVHLPIGALFAGDERRVVLALTVDAGPAGTSAGALAADLEYRAVADGRQVRVAAGRLAVVSVPTARDAEATRDAAVYAESEATAIAARQALAVRAWREGDGAGAAEIVQDNVAALTAINRVANSTAIAAQISEYRRDQATFGSVGADSDPGRGYALRSNADNRARQQRSTTP